MRHRHCLILILVSAALALPASEFILGRASQFPSFSGHSIDDQGTFILSLAGQKIGTEKFEISSSKHQIEAKAEIELHLQQEGKTLELRAFPDLVMNDRFEPLAYTWNQNGSQVSHLDIDFRARPTKCRYRTVTGAEDIRDIDLPRDVLVLDATNVVHHYQLLVDRYRTTSGGKQSFHAFVPQEAWPTVLTVEEKGKEHVDFGGQTEILQHLVVTTEGAAIDLWADDGGHLERVANTEGQFEAVRKK